MGNFGGHWQYKKNAKCPYHGIWSHSIEMYVIHWGEILKKDISIYPRYLVNSGNSDWLIFSVLSKSLKLLFLPLSSQSPSLSLSSHWQRQYATGGLLRDYKILCKLLKYTLMANKGYWEERSKNRFGTLSREIISFSIICYIPIICMHVTIWDVQIYFKFPP